MATENPQKLQRHLINVLALNVAFSSTHLYDDPDFFYVRTINNKILKQFLSNYKFETIMGYEPPEGLNLIFGSKKSTTANADS